MICVPGAGAFPFIFGARSFGVRLTALAARSQLSLAAASELVDDLQQPGYLQRRPDLSDGRAKLIHPTPRGLQALNDAGDRVAEIEHHWAELVGEAEFDAACRTLQHLLDATAPQSQPPLSPLPLKKSHGQPLG
jgi:DNA-binding MarR family transcriptional regulator